MDFQSEESLVTRFILVQDISWNTVNHSFLNDIIITVIGNFMDNNLNLKLCPDIFFFNWYGRNYIL